MATETSIPSLDELPSTSHTVNPEEQKDEFTFLDLMVVVAQGKWLIAKITVAFAILSIAVSFFLPKRYTAQASLLPPQQNTSIGAEFASQLGSIGGMAALAASGGGAASSLLKNPADMYVGMLRSRTVEDAMVGKFGLMQEYHKKYPSDARRVFEHWAKVDGNGKDGLIRISVEDPDPRRAAEMANGYIDQFRKLTESLAITEAGQRRMFFQQQMEHAKDNLADAEVALAQTEQKTGLIELDSQARALIESAAALRAQITAKEVQIEGMKTYATGENAQLVQAQQELDGLRAQLTRLGGNADVPGSDILPAKGQMTASGLEYVRRLRDVKYYETIFDILARQFEVAKLDEAKEGSVIQVVDAAIPPDKRSFPKRGLIVTICTVLGFLIGVLAAFVKPVLRNLQANPESGRKLSYLRSALTFRRSNRTA